MSSSTHSDHADSFEPVQRHRGQLVDVTPIAGETRQGAAAARKIAGFFGVVASHVVESDDERRFFSEDVLAADDQL